MIAKNDTRTFSSALLQRFLWMLLLLSCNVFYHPANAQRIATALDVNALLRIDGTNNCELQVSISSNLPGCDGNTLCLTILGGIGPYKILVDGESRATSLLGLAVCIQNLRPGNHVVKIVDSRGCEGGLNVNILSLTDLLKPVIKPVTCHGGADGSISMDLSVLVGTDISTLFCKWEGPDGYHGEGKDIKNLKAGKYSVRILAVGNICIGTGTWEVQQSEPVKIDIGISNATCGTANVCAFIKGGKAPYRVWGFNTLPGTATDDNFLNFVRPESHDPANCTVYDPNSNRSPFCIDNLPAGSYYVLVQDANGCYAWKIFRVNASARFERQLDVANISCYGEQDGKICFKIRGDKPPYKTTLATSTSSNARTIEGESGCFDNLPAGEYLLTTTDGSGCASSERIKITTPADLEAIFVLENNNCREGASGCLKISGGTHPYHIYVWNHPNPTADVGFEIAYYDNGLPYIKNAQRSTAFNFPPVLSQNGPFCARNIPPGDYILLVLDANNCYEIVTVNIPKLNNLEAKFEVSGGNCGEGGSGCLTIEGGSQPYKVYVWGWNSPLTVIPTVRFDASGKPQVEGGRPTEWQWSTPGIAPPYQICASNIPPGYYYLLVVDSNGCYKWIPVSIPRSNSVQLTTRVKNVSCFGEKNGQIYVVIEGGEQPYTIYFNGNVNAGRPINSSLTIVFDSLKAGIYKIEVKDKNGCSATTEVKVGEPEPLTGEFIPDQSNPCDGVNSGCIKVKGGTRPYNVQIWRWDNPSNVSPTVRFNTTTNRWEIEGAVTLNIQLAPPSPASDTWCFRSLPPGYYLVLVVDANGCNNLIPIHVPEIIRLQLSAEVINAGCNARVGKVKLRIKGGNAPYQIKFGDRTLITIDSIVLLENVAPGTYQIWVYDKFQCSAELKIVVKAAQIDANLTYDKYGSYACVNPSGGVPPYKIEWLNLETSAVVSNDTCVRNLAASVYLVTIFDNSGCSVQHWLVIEPPQCEGGIAKVAPESIVSGEGTKFSLSGHIGGSIQWQFKTDFTEWIDVPGATSETYATPPIHTSWDKIIKVRAKIKCADGSFVFSTETAFKIRGNHLLAPYDARVEDAQLFNPEFRKLEIITIERNRDHETDENVLIYPTIAKDLVKVRLLTATQSTINIHILNSLGSVVYQTQQDGAYAGDEISLPVQQLTAGTYFVRVENGQRVETQRIVVQ